MEKITLEIRTENAAFDNEPGIEIARILRQIAGRFEVLGDDSSGRIVDINGNKVGYVNIYES